ncbi:Sec-independent protein translocase protein TatB [Halomonas salifodinae]|uniref:Sec-independent protein translocase protein TatB n=1 Tax=Halomonas salifodinae TaxID=438745 RepID=UPI0033B70324
MFDIGFLELLIIGVVGLLVLGPERLPKAARTLGLWIGKIKRTVSGMQREISAQLEAEELRQKLNEQQKKLDESLGRAKREVEGIGESKRPADKAAEGSPGHAGEETSERASPLERLDDALARKADGEKPTAEDTAPPAADRAASRSKDSSTP